MMLMLMMLLVALTTGNSQSKIAGDVAVSQRIDTLKIWIGYPKDNGGSFLMGLSELYLVRTITKYKLTQDEVSNKIFNKKWIEVSIPRDAQILYMPYKRDDLDREIFK